MKQVKNRYRCYRLRKQVSKTYRVSVKIRTVYIPVSDVMTCADNKYLLALLLEFNYQIQLILFNYEKEFNCENE